MLEKQGPRPRSEGQWCVFARWKEAETREGQPCSRGREESCVTSTLARKAPSFWFCLKVATSFCRAEGPSHMWTPCAYFVCQKQFYRESLFDGFLIQETFSFLKLCDIRI